MSAPLLEVSHLSVRYALGRTSPWNQQRSVLALSDISLSVIEGRSLGVVGESGSGKSTLARAVLGLAQPEAGEIRWCGRPLQTGDRRAMQAVRRDIQVIFQDPFGSLDPRMTAGASVMEAIAALDRPVAPDEARERVRCAFSEVGLDWGIANRYPHQLSGGQCQRVAIARATVVRPRLLICDEAVSALDVSIQAQVVNLLRDLAEQHAMTLLFISHNLAVVRHICVDVAVLRAGRLLEFASSETVFTAPTDPYTRDLLDAVPDPEAALRRRARHEAARP